MKRLPLKGLAWLVALVAMCMCAAACGGGSKSKTSGTSTGSSTGSSTTASAPSGAAVGGKLVIDNESGSTWTCQFNPFNASLLGPGITFGYIYEPLEYVNILESTKAPVPMLASSSKWTNGYRTLTFTIRSGVKWTDGTPFTAKDVLYTFDAIKKDRAADLNALWHNAGGPLTAVASKGANKVVFTFNAPAQTYFYYVADQTPIVPQHIWSKLDQTSSPPTPTRARWAPGPTRSPAARRRTSSTCATRATGRASPVIRCRASRRSTTRRSCTTPRPTWSSPRVRRSGVASTSRTSRPTTSPRTRRTATSGSRRS